MLRYHHQQHLQQSISTRQTPGFEELWFVQSVEPIFRFIFVISFCIHCYVECHCWLANDLNLKVNLVKLNSRIVCIVICSKSIGFDFFRMRMFRSGNAHRRIADVIACDNCCPAFMFHITCASPECMFRTLTILNVFVATIHQHLATALRFHEFQSPTYNCWGDGEREKTKWEY